MNDDAQEIVVRYNEAAEARRALRRMRRFGFGSPRDHLIVEGAKILLVCIPVPLVLAGSIRFDQAVAAYCGYFALRWFNRFIKPALLERFGPRLPTERGDYPLTITFNADGARSESAHARLDLPWRSVSPPQNFTGGVILRIGPEQSLVVAADRLPDGWTPALFSGQIEVWRKEAGA